MEYSDFLKRSKLNDSDLVLVTQYGSQVYGTARKNSDFDFIVVTTNKTKDQYSDSLININFFTPEEHQKRLDDHEISAIECFFVNHAHVLKDVGRLWFTLQKRKPFEFNLDRVKLRHSLSAKSSNSWVKAKKKLTVEKDYDLDLGRKSLFHAFRIIDFGIQLADHGRIIDYQSCNYLFVEIMNHYTWDTMFDEYKKRYNELCSKFRVLAPKD